MIPKYDKVCSKIREPYLVHSFVWFYFFVCFVREDEQCTINYPLLLFLRIY